MKIIIAIGSLWGGGAETQCRIVVNELIKKKYTVAVILFKDNIGTNLIPKEVKIYNVGSRQDKNLLSRFNGIRKAIKEFTPDLVYSWLPETISIPATIFAKLYGIPSITSRRSSYKSIIIGGEFRTYLNIIAELFSNIIISNSIVLRKDSLLYYIVFKFKKGIVIHNGIEKAPKEDTSLISTIKSDLNFKIIYVGRFIKTKRLDLLIEAFAILRSQGIKISLYLCGGNKEDFPIAKTILSKYNIDDSNIHFLGFVENWRTFASAFDLYVSPSILEGSSNSTLEAFSVNLPVIATNIPANTSICKNEESAILINPNNLEELVDAISMLINNPNKIKHLTNNAKIIINNLSVNNLIDNLEKVINSLVKAKSK